MDQPVIAVALGFYEEERVVARTTALNESLIQATLNE
jgi:hypothetical protein